MIIATDTHGYTRMFGATDAHGATRMFIATDARGATRIRKADLVVLPYLIDPCVTVCIRGQEIRVHP